MPAPLSLDLRQRIVTRYLSGQGTYEDVADHFSVGKASVVRFVSQYRRSGRLEPKAATGGQESKLNEKALATLRSLVEEQPDRTVYELAVALEEQTGISVGTSTISRGLAKLRLTRKKRHW